MNTPASKTIYNAAWLASQPLSVQQAFIKSLSERELEWYNHDWQIWSRPEQRQPPGDWFVWLLRSGRGFGKTRTGAEWVRERVAAGYKRIALVGQTKADVRDTMLEVGDSALLNIYPKGDAPTFVPSQRRVVWPNGAIAVVYSGDEPDQLRGPQHDTAWVDELAKFRYPDETWSNLLLGLRIGRDPRVVVTTTPRPIRLIKELRSKATTVDSQYPTDMNIANLSPTYIREVIDPLRNTRLGRQEIEGELLEDTPGALWTQEMIDSSRSTSVPPLVRVVVGVDPTATTRGDAAGIVVAGVGTDGHGYVLADDTVQGSPNTWGSRAVQSYHTHQADRIVAETNNGGEMVELTVRTVDGSVAYKGVWASRGKRTRAEPIAAMYEQRRIHHVGNLAELENEMTTWAPEDKDSPNRMDALVWALTELFLSEQVPVRGVVSLAERVDISPY
jgi:phage terminase large subunit-like protein